MANGLVLDALRRATATLRGTGREPVLVGGLAAELAECERTAMEEP